MAEQKRPYYIPPKKKQQTVTQQPSAVPSLIIALWDAVIEQMPPKRKKSK